MGLRISDLVCLKRHPIENDMEIGANGRFREFLPGAGEIVERHDARFIFDRLDGLAEYDSPVTCNGGMTGA